MNFFFRLIFVKKLENLDKIEFLDINLPFRTVCTACRSIIITKTWGVQTQ